MAINSGKLLKPATVKMLQASQRLPSGEETGYGLGWDLETATIAGQVGAHGRPRRRHCWWDGRRRFMTLPERGIVVAVTSNTSFADTASIALKIAEAFAEQGRSPARK